MSSFSVPAAPRAASHLPTRTTLRLAAALSTLLLVVTSAQASEQILPSNTVLVTQGGASVTLADLDAAFSRLAPENRDKAARDGNTIEAELTRILQQRMLALQAPTDREQDARRNAALAAAKQQAEDDFLARERMEQFRRELQSADYAAMARERFMVDRAKFRLPERIDVRHVLIDTSQRSAEEALVIAEQVLAEAKAGADFAKLAEQYSDDPGSKAQGGLYEGVVLGQMVKPFEDTAFAMQTPGELSAPVATEYGYHVIQFVARHPARPQNFAEVEQQLIDDVRNAHIATAEREFLGALRGEAMDINESAMGSIQSRYQAITQPEAKPR